MTKLTGKNVKFAWSEEYERSFSALKDMLTIAPVLVLSKADQPYVVYTNASITGLGCVLKPSPETAWEGDSLCLSTIEEA